MNLSTGKCFRLRYPYAMMPVAAVWNRTVTAFILEDWGWLNVSEY